SDRSLARELLVVSESIDLPELEVPLELIGRSLELLLGITLEIAVQVRRDPLLASNLRKQLDAIFLLLVLSDLGILLLNLLLELTHLLDLLVKLLLEILSIRLTVAVSLSVILISLRLVFPTAGLGLEVVVSVEELRNHTSGFLVRLLQLVDNFLDRRHGVPFGSSSRVLLIGSVARSGTDSPRHRAILCICSLETGCTPLKGSVDPTNSAAFLILDTSLDWVSEE